MKKYKVLILAVAGFLMIANPELPLAAQPNQGGSNLNSMSPGNPNRPGDPGRPFSPAAPNPGTSPSTPVHADTGTPAAPVPGNGTITDTGSSHTGNNSSSAGSSGR